MHSEQTERYNSASLSGCSLHLVLRVVGAGDDVTSLVLHDLGSHCERVCSQSDVKQETAEAFWEKNDTCNALENVLEKE